MHACHWLINAVVASHICSRCLYVSMAAKHKAACQAPRSLNQKDCLRAVAHTHHLGLTPMNGRDINHTGTHRRRRWWWRRIKMRVSEVGGGAYLNANQNTYRFSNDTRTHYTHQYFMNIQQWHFLLFFYSFIQLKPSAQFLHWIYWTAVNDTDSRVWLHSGAVPQKRHKLKLR